MKGKINWKKELSAAFAASAPKGKEAFLRTLRYPRLGYAGFLLQQFRYLRKRVWLLCIALILMSTLLSVLPTEVLTQNSATGKSWLIAALLPLLALLATAELSRSSCWRMAELEMSCRFCLQQVVAARVLLLGLSNGAVLLAVLLLLGRLSPFGFGRMALYLLAPYLLTSALCLLLLSHVRGREGLYGCTATACAISMLDSILDSAAHALYGSEMVRWWLLLATASIGILIFQLYQLGKDWRRDKAAYS